MELPELKQYRQKTRRQIVTFGGLNYTDAPTDGELSVSEGLSSARYPALSQRGGRTEAEGSYTAPTAIFAWDKLCVVDGTDFYYGGVRRGSVLVGEKQFAVVNTKLVIWPDKVYFDLTDLSIHQMTAAASSGIGYSFTEVDTAKGGVTFTGDSMTFNVARTGATVDTDVLMARSPTDLTGVYTYLLTYPGISWNGDGTIASSPSVTRMDNLVPGRYVVPTASNTIEVISRGVTESAPSVSAFTAALNTGRTYGIVNACGVYYVDGEESVTATRLASVNYYSGTPDVFSLSSVFSVGDAVSITGCETFEANNKSAIITAISGNTVTFASGAFTGTGVEIGDVTIERGLPNLDFICEWDNRLWGVSNSTENIIYDEDGNESTVNSRVIYGSALGDPTNFNVFAGLSTDSYSVAVASNGDFTGITAYSNSLLCWKESRLHKIVGSMPSDYYLYTYDITGLQAGSHKSMAVINEVLYYKGRNGIYAYAGSTPELISYKLGLKRFSGAVAGEDGLRYYVSMMDADEAWHLFVYDTLHGLWMREDDTHAVDFTALDGALYFLSGTTLYLADQSDSAETVEWLAEFTPFTETVHQRKSYSRVYLRLELDSGAWLKVEVKCDDWPWYTVTTLSNPTKKTVTLPIRPNRCDAFRIRLSGKGGCVISSMVREYQLGSEV